MKKNPAFALISFAVLKWHECLSFQLPFELTVEIPVQLHLELEVNLLVRNVVEREIESERLQMKPPLCSNDIFINWWNRKQKSVDETSSRWVSWTLKESGNRKCPLNPGFFFTFKDGPTCFASLFVLLDSKVFFRLGELKLHFDVKYKVAVVYSGS